MLSGRQLSELRRFPDRSRSRNEQGLLAEPGELVRASLVVLVTIFFLGFVLAAFDLVWIWFFNLLRIFNA